MIKIGDKVKFLNDVGGGVVVGFQGKSMAVVEDHDGFEIPALISALVKVEDEKPRIEVRRDTPRAEAPVQPVAPQKEVEEAPLIIEGNDKPAFYMAFHPVDAKNILGGNIEIYLINDSNFSLLYHYAHYDGKNYTTVDSGVLESNTKTFLEYIAQPDLNDLPVYCFRMIPFMQKSASLSVPIIKEVKVNAMKFYKETSFKSNDFFKNKSMVFDLVVNPMSEAIDKLTDQDFKAVVEEKDKANRPRIPRTEKIVQPEVVEVDLHIENLLDTHSGLSNHEILQIQMDRFHSEMKLAIDGKVKRIVFIHGVGNGVLKQDIHKKLKSSYARYFFQDASFQEYGYGATMVILRRG